MEGIFKPSYKNEAIIKNTKTNKLTIFDTLNLAPQWFKIDNSQEQYIQTKAGIGLNFDKNSFKNRVSHISPTTSKYMFYIYFRQDALK